MISRKSDSLGIILSGKPLSPMLLTDTGCVTALNSRGLIDAFKRKMEGLEAVLLALSAPKSSSRKIRSDIKWTFNIKGTFYKLNALGSIGVELLRLDKTFPRNVAYF
jgi:hypothetical protein